VDVWPDGIPRFLCHGVLRARFRDSFHEPTLLEPGEVYRFRFEMDPVGVRMLPGHRLRVELSSSWFPRFDRNTGSGAANNFLDDQVVVATQTVLHDAGHPSHILLPVIPAEA
jgi:putative CocE/NonD family hydrolase